MIQIPDSMKKRLAEALTDRHPVVVAYVDSTGGPHLSFYGSVHAYSDDQLGLWARKPEGELAGAVERDPRIALIYSDMANRVFYRMSGRVRRADDPAERDRVFDGMHQFEQAGDPERGGVAFIVDLDSVVGRGEDGQIFRMEREG